jgi:GTP-binding protein HflX
MPTQGPHVVTAGEALWFDRPARGQRAALVHVELRTAPVSPEEEFHELARALGLTAVHTLSAVRSQSDPRLCIGEGKAQELKARLAEAPVDWVVFDCELSPTHERNLEQLLEARVIDRTGLILEIFAQRAETFEGKLQVELAQLQHLSTRLVRGWTHLERQQGGIGMRGGPGEKQIELDRRIIARRIDRLRQRLEEVRRRRAEGRRARLRAGLPVVALVGYTNAGKSSLFNALTGAFSVAADQLFATLDPRLRHRQVPGIGPVVFGDTVGFIRHLPHALVAAFRATLEEAAHASLLLHVIDRSDPEWEDKRAQVLAVLESIGAGEVPVLEVLNKIDRVPGIRPHLVRDEEGNPMRVHVSALREEGLSELAAAVSERLAGGVLDRHRLHLPAAAGRLRSRLYALGAVEGEVAEDGHHVLDVALEGSRLQRLLAREGYELEALAGPRGPLGGGPGVTPETQRN